MVPTFLVFFFNFSFTVILTLPAFFAVITPDLLTEAFLLEALKEYFAFFFFDFIEIFFFCPTVNVSFFLTSFAFAAAVAGVKALSVDTASAKHKPMLMVCFFNMFMINPPHIILWLYFSIVWLAWTWFIMSKIWIIHAFCRGWFDYCSLLCNKYGINSDW